MGNPFDENSDEITILNTKEVMSEEVARSVICAHEVHKPEVTFVYFINIS